MKCEKCNIDMKKVETKDFDSHKVLHIYVCPQCDRKQTELVDIVDRDD